MHNVLGDALQLSWPRVREGRADALEAFRNLDRDDLRDSLADAGQQVQGMNVFLRDLYARRGELRHYASENNLSSHRPRRKAALDKIIYCSNSLNEGMKKLEKEAKKIHSILDHFGTDAARAEEKFTNPPPLDPKKLMDKNGNAVEPIATAYVNANEEHCRCLSDCKASQGAPFQWCSADCGKDGGYEKLNLKDPTGRDHRLYFIEFRIIILVT